MSRVLSFSRCAVLSSLETYYHELKALQEAKHRKKQSSCCIEFAFLFSGRKAKSTLRSGAGFASAFCNSSLSLWSLFSLHACRILQICWDSRLHYGVRSRKYSITWAILSHWYIRNDVYYANSLDNDREGQRMIAQEQHNNRAKKYLDNIHIVLSEFWPWLIDLFSDDPASKTLGRCSCAEQEMRRWMRQGRSLKICHEGPRKLKPW